MPLREVAMMFIVDFERRHHSKDDAGKVYREWKSLAKSMKIDVVEAEELKKERLDSQLGAVEAMFGDTD